MGKESAADAGMIEDLLDLTFGPQRHQKTCQRLRDDQTPSEGMAFVVRQLADDHACPSEAPVVATLRFWDIRIGFRTHALLLGPLAVHPALQGEGLGGKLIRHGLREAIARRHQAVLLVGDEPYYRRFGFLQHYTRRMQLPGPVDRDRFLGLELMPGALSGACGMIAPCYQDKGLEQTALAA